MVIEHLALVAWYPESQAVKHWNTELEAFKMALKRYNNGQKRRQNFDFDDIVAELESQMCSHADEDHLILAVGSHGEVPPVDPDWDLLKIEIAEFAQSLLV